MGKKGEDAKKNGLDLHDLPDVLGEGMPKLEFHALGRIRLMRALQQRFGSGYRNVPGVSSVMQKFDEQAKLELHYHHLKQKLGRK
jgi:hypothetical protein